MRRSAYASCTPINPITPRLDACASHERGRRTRRGRGTGALATSGLCRSCGSLLFGMDCTGRLFRACGPVQPLPLPKLPAFASVVPTTTTPPSKPPRLQQGCLLLGALPEHAGIALERHKPLTGIGPVLLLLEGDVIDRLAASAALKERARNVDHVP